MCSLAAEPWRANFTGGVCRCGVPMPGNDEERALDKQMRQELKVKQDANNRFAFEKYKQQRINELLNRLRGY